MSLPNVHLSNHPSLKAKLSQLRSHSTTSRDVKTLVHDISLILACEALAANLSSHDGPKVVNSPLSRPFSGHEESLIGSALVPVRYSVLTCGWNNNDEHIH